MQRGHAGRSCGKGAASLSAAPPLSTGAQLAARAAAVYDQRPVFVSGDPKVPIATPAGDPPRQIGPAAIAATVLAPFAAGYFLSYLFRAVNVVIAPDLARDLSLSAADLGLLTSIYYIVFAAFQVPLGILLDRYGPKRVHLSLLVFGVAGALLFAVGENFLVVAVGRGLIGLGVSGCLMSAIKANVMWWPRERLPLVNGIIGVSGSIGALTATVPVELALHVIGWRGLFLALAAITAALTVISLFVIPERDANPGGPSSAGGVRGQLHDLAQVYGNGFFWRICVMMFVHNSVFLGYQTLWLGPWLRDVAGMDGSGAAQTLLWFNAGMATGVITLGAVSERLQRIGVAPIAVIGVAVLASIATQSLLALEFTAFALPLCFAFGYFGSSGLLVYAVLGQTFPARLAGRVNTAQNMMVFIGTFVVQWGAGAIIGLWPQVAEGRYRPEAHQAAFGVMIAVEIAAYFWFLAAPFRPPRVDNPAGGGR
jgi:predicted MFS family arabinose efflux permease